MTRVPLVVAVAVVAALLSACSGGVENLPPPPKLPSTTSTAPPPDLSGIDLKPVPGRTTTTTLALGPGAANLQGSVRGPQGPLEGATVRVERVVGDAVGSADVPTQPDGTWSLPAVLGGRYRVRAWRAPDLALTKPDVFFLAANETKTLDLQLASYTGMTAVADIAPNPPYVKQPAELVVLVAERSVDEQGVVRAVPTAQVGVELSGSSSWRLSSPNEQLTDSAGRARWTLVCNDTGKHSLSLIVRNTQQFPLDLPACVPEPPPPEPPEDPDGTTSTTGAVRPSTPTSTTTTTRR